MPATQSLVARVYQTYAQLTIDNIINTFLYELCKMFISESFYGKDIKISHTSVYRLLYFVIICCNLLYNIFSFYLSSFYIDFELYIGKAVVIKRPY